MMTPAAGLTSSNAFVLETGVLVFVSWAGQIKVMVCIKMAINTSGYDSVSAQHLALLCWVNLGRLSVRKESSTI